MNFKETQEQLRAELLRRKDRGTLSVSLLARKTGLAQGHLSNFLNGRRHLSTESLDKLLAAANLEIADLLRPRGPSAALLTEQITAAERVPLVPHTTAMHEPYLSASNTLQALPFPVEAFAGLLVRCAPNRRQWERFLAIRISAEAARPMDPLLKPDALVLLDRHYQSFLPAHPGQPNLYAAISSNRLLIRYADFMARRVVLRPTTPPSPPKSSKSPPINPPTTSS